MNFQVGNFLVVTGIVLVVFGLAYSDRLGPLGNLPGDIRIEQENFGFYFPIMSSIAIGILLSFVFWVFGAFRE